MSDTKKILNHLHLIKLKIEKEKRQKDAQLASIKQFKGTLTGAFFCANILTDDTIHMDRDKLKLIVRNLKSLVDLLESEVYSDPESYKFDDRKDRYYQDLDDDDGYADQREPYET